MINGVKENACDHERKLYRGLYKVLGDHLPAHFLGIFVGKIIGINDQKYE